MDSNTTASQNDKNYVLVERVSDDLELPVGSVVTIGNRRVLYRDIDSQKHIFKKGNWQAIATDAIVIDYLTAKEQIDQVYFWLRDKSRMLKVNFDRYQQSKSVVMRGRPQKFVGLASFENDDNAAPVARPKERKVINI